MKIVAPVKFAVIEFFFIRQDLLDGQDLFFFIIFRPPAHKGLRPGGMKIMKRNQPKVE